MEASGCLSSQYSDVSLLSKFAYLPDSNGAEYGHKKAMGDAPSLRLLSV